MGFRFRRTSKLGPLRITLTHKGVSGSVGGGGLSYQLFGPGKRRSRQSAANRVSAPGGFERLIKSFIGFIGLTLTVSLMIAIWVASYRTVTDTRDEAPSDVTELRGPLPAVEGSEPASEQPHFASSLKELRQKTGVFGKDHIWFDSTGTHSTTGRLVEFRRGVAYLAIGERFKGVPTSKLSESDRQMLAKLPSYNELKGRVVSVVDGDTLMLHDESGGEQEIHLEGIDSPESSQEFADRSKDALAELTLGKNVIVEVDAKVESGPVFGHVFVNADWVNLKLLRDGWVWHFKGNGDCELFANGENTARASRNGLWAGISPQAPWELRAQLALEREKQREAELAAQRESLARREELARQQKKSSVSSSWSSTPSKSYSSSSGRVQVRGYYRKDGTYVRPHSRSR